MRVNNRRKASIVTTPLDIRETSASPASRPFLPRVKPERGSKRLWQACRWAASIPPVRLCIACFAGRNGLRKRNSILTAYPLMFLSRHLDERMEELFQKGICQRDRDYRHRQRGHCGGHVLAAASGPRRGVDHAPRRYRAFAFRRHAVPIVLPVHGQCPKPHARARGQRPSRQCLDAPLSHDQSLGKNAQPGGRRNLGCASGGRRCFRPGCFRRRRVKHRRIPRSLEHRLGAKVPGVVSHRKQLLRLFHAHKRPISIAGTFPIGRRATASEAGPSTAPTPGKSTRPFAMPSRPCKPTLCPGCWSA